MKKIIFLFVLMFSQFSLSADESLYKFEWMDDDKEIYVLQNRRFRKAGRVNLSLMGVMNLSDKFVNTIGGALKGAYFFKEDWGVELGFGIGAPSYNDTFDRVAEQSAVPFYNAITRFMSASVVWSPWYGKFNTFNVIYYLDWYVSLGVASVTTEDDRTAFDVSNSQVRAKQFTPTEDSSMGATWSTGFLWYLSKSIGIRLEFSGYHYNGSFFTKNTTVGGTSAPKSNFDVTFHNYNLSAGLNFLF